MKPRTEAGPHIGWPHCAVGMQSALESEIGLPSRSTSASRMLLVRNASGCEKELHNASRFECDGFVGHAVHGRVIA